MLPENLGYCIALFVYRISQGSFPILVPGIHIGTFGYQQLDHILTPLLGCKMKRSFANITLGVDVGTFDNQ